MRKISVTNSETFFCKNGFDLERDLSSRRKAHCGVGEKINRDEILMIFIRFVYVLMTSSVQKKKANTFDEKRTVNKKKTT